MARVILKKNEDRRISSGHLWVFSNEIAQVDGSAENGAIVEVYDRKSNLLGQGFYNKNSLIAVRLLAASFDGDFHKYANQRITASFELRKLLYPDRTSYRLVFSESDLMPGLIVDRFNDSYVLQVYSFGMEKNIDYVVDVLRTEAGASNVFSKNEEHLRALEGLPVQDTVYLGQVRDELISDGKISYRVDLSKGQKTGFYFDQCDNRELTEKFVKDKNVLDAFCYSGGFGLHAAYAGAKTVTFLDSSSDEIENTRNNFRLNGFNIPAEFIVDDVFDHLEACAHQGKKFDVIMIDPPAFAKSKKNLAAAVKGYIKLNRLALGLLGKGGILATSSCSYHLKKNDFMDVIVKAAVKANRKVQLIHSGGASLDHPELPAMEETSYLKFVILRVLE